MNENDALRHFYDRFLGPVDRHRSLIAIVGAVCALLGVVSLAMPFLLFSSLIAAVGCVLLATGTIKLAQLLFGLKSTGVRRHTWPMVLWQSALDFGMALVLFNYRSFSVSVLAMVLGALFLVEAGVFLFVGLKAPTARVRAILCVAAIVTGGLALAAFFQYRSNRVEWVGIVIGVKLLLFGAALLAIAVFAPRGSAEILYQTGSLVPEPAELYAVYFGTAFHLGVYVGDGMVVHYLNDNGVYHVTWETFLEDRKPQHWTYPDLAPVAADVVIRTALGEVGKHYPYNLLTFNCEHFAIYCKSGGKTRSSQFAQIRSGLSAVTVHPVLGIVAEMNTRVFEWLAFHLGGPSGKSFSLAIRQFGSLVNAWLLALGSKSKASAATGLAESGEDS
jgi:uncharacterized membrane protein HdeD (DUF308 family)